MMKIYFIIAGFNLKVNIYNSNKSNRLENDIRDIYQSFIIPKTSKKIDFCIEIYNKPFQQPIRILSKRTRGIKENYIFLFEEEEHKIKTFYYISINQFVSILIIALQKILVQNKSFILHSSAINFKNKAVIFTGTKGAGKSTIIRMLRNKYQALADDTIIIKREHKEFYCYQTPFVEKNYWIKKGMIGYKIGAIFLLKKASFFKIKKISNKVYIYSYLTNKLFTDGKNIQSQINYLLDFTNTFDNFYFLYFKKDSKGLERVIESYLKR